jgi:hypothetical protein
MRVLNIFFLDMFPHLPVYEMADRSIRLPFINPKSGASYYMTESEVLEGISDSKQKQAMVKPFTQARAAIVDIRTKELHAKQIPKKELILPS